MKKKYLLITTLLFCITVFSQENANSSFDISLKNSIKFNKYLINPAFSFAKETAPTLTIVNRRQWVDFENAPQFYFANYLGRLSNRSRFGIGIYQQSAGVLKNFGGVVNYSYAVPVGDESILAFGINTYFYNSTFDFGKIITVENEPLLQNQKANSLIGLKPGINFGTEFFDFGVSVNNLVLYNLATSEMVKDNQENSYLGHVMYTGYINSYRRFLDDAKFSTLVFVEKKNDATALAANLLLDIPNKAWIQGGYNTLYGFSAGVGITISERFSLGYNYDLGLGDVSELGSSHQFLLAYTFDEYENINITNRVKKQGGSKKPVKKTSTTIALKTKAQKDKENAEKLANAKLERERLAAEAAANAEKNRLANEEAARLKAAEDKAKLEAPVNIQAEKDRLAAEEAARIKAAADKAKAEAAAKAQAEKDRLASEEAARLKAAERAKSDKARAAAAAKTQAEKDRLAAEEAARLKAAAEKAKAEAAAKTQAEKDRLAAEEAARLKAAADKAKAEAAAKTQAEKDRLAAEETARLKAAADKAKAEAAAKTQAEKDRLAGEEAARLKAAADKAKAEAAAKAQAEKDRLAAEEAARLKAAADKAKAEAAAKAQAEKDRLAAEEAARLKAAADKAKAEAAAKAQAEKDRLAAEEAARLKAAADKAKAEAAAKALAEKDRLAAEEAARLKAAADKAKAEAAAKAQAEKDKLSTEEALRKKLESDESNKAVEAFKKDIETKSNASDELTKSLEAIVKERDADLKEFLLENTLNADGTVRGPKGFVNTKEENAKLENLKSRISLNKVEFDKLIRDFEASNIQRLKEIKAKGISDTDAKPLNDYYQKMLNDLKQKRETFNRLEKEADLKIQKIKDEKEAERLRRIKKADYDSETERNRRNQEYLEGLKKNQEVVGGNDTAPKNKEGESTNNPNAIIDIPIIKKLTDVSAGYYLVLKTFSNLEETKAYLSTVISAGGGANVNFFYNLHNSTYYVYIAKADTMGDANQELKAKGTKTYNKNMFIAKVE